MPFGFSLLSFPGSITLIPPSMQGGSKSPGAVRHWSCVSSLVRTGLMPTVITSCWPSMTGAGGASTILTFGFDGASCAPTSTRATQ